MHHQVARSITATAVFVLVCQSFAAEAPPEAFRRAVEQKRLTSPVDIQLTFVDHRKSDHGALRYRLQTARNGDRWLENSGNEDGWTRFDLTGPISRLPQVQLRRSADLWQFARSSPMVTLYEAPATITTNADPIMDFERMPMLPPGLTMDHVRYASERGTWSESLTNDGNWKNSLSYNGMTATWTIDPRRDWTPIRVELVQMDESGSRILGSSSVDVQLVKHGGEWIPSSIVALENGGLTMSVAVEDIRTPSSPAGQFTPEMIGVEAGFNVYAPDREYSKRVGRWTGTAVVDGAEYIRLLRSGEVKTGPTLLARQRGEPSPNMTPEQVEDWHRSQRRASLRLRAQQAAGAWEQYVEHFIRKYRLDDEQAERCRAILADCTEQKNRKLADVAERIAELRKDFDRISAGDDLSEAERRADELDRLSRPGRQIFDQQLKPRLERIPTAAQRAAVEGRPTTRTAASQPAVAPPANP